MNLSRRNTVLLTIKPVGSMKSFFAEDEYTIDVKNCIDVIFYIQSMHPKLGLFMKQAEALATFEDFCFLDAESKIIDPQLFPYHKFKAILTAMLVIVWATPADMKDIEAANEASAATPPIPTCGPSAATICGA